MSKLGLAQAEDCALTSIQWQQHMQLAQLISRHCHPQVHCCWPAKNPGCSPAVTQRLALAAAMHRLLTSCLIKP